MEEIQIGEYVRTNYGIKRIDTIFENRPVNRYGYEIGSDWDGKEYSIIKPTDIVKHSKNILDVIEDGDYVNGVKVKCRYEGIFDRGIELVNRYRIDTLSQFTKIETILTHEQYENNCYRIGE